MADAWVFAGGRSESQHLARIKGAIFLAGGLIAPALLLGLWRVWSSEMAPKLGFFFTAEALLIAYAYFAVVRTTHIAVHACDRFGAYTPALAAKAAQDFHRGLRLNWLRIAMAVLGLLAAALALDMLTTDSGLQRRPNLHLTILFIEIMIWARYGAAVVLAAALWSPAEPPAFARARELAARPVVSRAFVRHNIAFGVFALLAVAAFKWGGSLLPTARAELFCAAALFALIAFTALWLQCRWALTVLPRLERRQVEGVPARVLARAA